MRQKLEVYGTKERHYTSEMVLGYFLLPQKKYETLYLSVALKKYGGENQNNNIGGKTCIIKIKDNLKKIGNW